LRGMAIICQNESEGILADINVSFESNIRYRFSVNSVSERQKAQASS
jgi:hypothetical protein